MLPRETCAPKIDLRECGVVRVCGGGHDPVGLLGGRRDHGLDREEDLDVLGPASAGESRVVHPLPVLPHRLLVQGSERQLDVGVRSRERQAASGAAGGDDGRLAVREGQGVQRAVEVVVGAAVLHRTHARAVRVDP